MKPEVKPEPKADMSQPGTAIVAAPLEGMSVLEAAIGKGQSASMCMLSACCLCSVCDHCIETRNASILQSTKGGFVVRNYMSACK